jgi:hypothetical protein
MIFLITILVTLLMLSSGTYTAKAVRVSDGGKLMVLTEIKEQMRTRLGGFSKVEMSSDSQKLDLYIGNMVRLNELENSAEDLRQCLI